MHKAVQAAVPEFILILQYESKRNLFGNAYPLFGY